MPILVQHFLCGYALGNAEGVRKAGSRAAGAHVCVTVCGSTTYVQYVWQESYLSLCPTASIEDLWCVLDPSTLIHMHTVRTYVRTYEYNQCTRYIHSLIVDFCHIFHQSLCDESAVTHADYPHLPHKKTQLLCTYVHNSSEKVYILLCSAPHAYTCECVCEHASVCRCV